MRRSIRNRPISLAYRSVIELLVLIEGIRGMQQSLGNGAARDDLQEMIDRRVSKHVGR